MLSDTTVIDRDLFDYLQTVEEVLLTNNENTKFQINKDVDDGSELGFLATIFFNKVQYILF